MGTSDIKDGEERTKIESPAARNKTPPPPRAAVARPELETNRGPDDAQRQLGNILGTYRLLELLGKGGMGYVYRAEHTKLGREVALKLLRVDYARRRDAVLRFFQEAKTVNRVRHRNIVDVTDFVELDDGTTFIIMEFLRGQSLGKWARGGVDLPRALAVLVQICDGLGAAHAVGVIHRDLKPDNVIVVPTNDGAELVKLLDFGVAKLVNRDDEDIGFQTAAGSVIGTPAYMSPEQAGGMAIDHRSDIYSLGAIMYELFCGTPMFRGRSFGEYVRKHLTEMPTPPRQTQHGANMDPRLEALILKSLAKDPNERFSHILELRDGLLHMLGAVEPPSNPSQPSLQHTGPPRPVLPTTQLPPHMLPLPAPAVITTIPTPHSQPISSLHPSVVYGQYSQVPLSESSTPTPWWLWFIGGALAVGIGIAGAVWYANRGDGPVDPPNTTTLTAPPPKDVTNPNVAVEPVPAKPNIVGLRFDSMPKAGVFAEGHAAELCRTPCSFDVNLADGGPQDRRKFIVHQDGYKDQAVEVDFASGKLEYALTLDPIGPPHALPVAPTGDQTDPKHTKLGKTGHPTKSTTKTADKTTDKTANERKESSEDKTTDKATEPEAQKPPEVKKSEPPKGSGKIDQTETLDPFHRHTP